MSWDWLRLESKFDGLEPPERATYISAGGTWSFPDQGFQADVGRLLNDERWAWKPIVYSTSFGPVAGPVDALSYEESVGTGHTNGIFAINATPGRFALGGYSMGAEVVRRLQRELVTGALQHRRKDCVGIVTFGDPMRQKSDPVFGGGKGWGISREVVPPNEIPVHTYAIPGDMYCTAPDGAAGDNMHAVYAMLTDLQLHNFGALVTDFLSSALLKQAALLATNPVGGAPGVIEALVRLVQFAATNAHGLYGPWVMHAVDFLNARV